MTKSVLLVEPEIELGHLLEVLLRLVFDEVVRVRSAAEFEAALVDLKPSAVVLGLLLPDGDGRDLLRRIRAASPLLPVLAIDISPGGQLRAPALLAGADHVVTTPPDPALLVAALEGMMRRAQSAERASHHDALTGLLNRSGIRAEWDRILAMGFGPPAVAVLEFDDFDRLRGEGGVEWSEDLLLQAAHKLQAELEPSGTLGRWAGETFLALLPGLSNKRAVAHLETALAAFRDARFPAATGKDLRLAFSAGVTVPATGATFDEVVAGGARLLERAHRGGGGRVEGSRSEPDESSEGVILLAEDDPLTAELLRHRLEREGYRLLHAKDGITAYDWALANPVALAILDVKMPGMDGFELLERLRRIPSWAGVPIVMLTALGRESDVVRGFRLGADDYVVKPFSPQQFLARIRRFLP